MCDGVRALNKNLIFLVTFVLRLISLTLLDFGREKLISS
jgi:hypothetical protein